MTEQSASAQLIRAILDLRIDLEVLTEKVARATRLNPRDLGILDVLNAEGPRTPKELTERTGMHAATVTSILNRLERDGRIKRQPNPDDKRSWRIHIVRATVRELDLQFSSVNSALKPRLDALTPSTRLIIARFLNEVGAIVRRSGNGGT